MRAAPIVDSKVNMQASQENKEVNSSKKLEVEITPVGFPTRTASNFKNELMNKLAQKNKVLYLKFEILTKEKLFDCLQNGCRILQLNCQAVEQDALCVEGEYGKLERMSIEEIKDVFSAKSMLSSGMLSSQLLQHENKIIDVLILAAKNAPSLVQLFLELKIPHIITFEFTSGEYDYRHKIYEDECVDKFCIFFYEELVDEKSVLEAYKNSLQKTFLYLSEKYFEGKSRDYIMKIIGAGPILLPNDEEQHNEVLFNENFPLAKGKIEDISTTRYPTNLEKMLVPFTGRNKELYLVMKKITEKKGFLKITGPAGSGKTAFALRAGYYLLTRNKFSDGIFYIPLKKIKQQNNSHYDIKDLLKETLGLDTQSGYVNFFRGKNMLLIFDDFDTFYHKDSIEYNRLLFITLRDCDITCIFITTSNPKGEIQLKKKLLADYKQKKKEIEGELQLDKSKKWKLRPMTDEELAHLLISLTKPDKQIVNDLNVAKLKGSQWIKLSQGNPKFLIDRLLEKKIEFQKKVLEINPIYEKQINIEAKYLQSIKMPNVNTSLNLTRANSSIYENKLTRTVSDNRGYHPGTPGLKKEKLALPVNTELYKTKSHFHEASPNPGLTKILDDDKSTKNYSTKTKSKVKKKNNNFLESDDSIIQTRTDFDQSREFRPSRSHPAISEASYEEEKIGNLVLDNDDNLSNKHDRDDFFENQSHADNSKFFSDLDIDNLEEDISFNIQGASDVASQSEESVESQTTTKKKQNTSTNTTTTTNAKNGKNRGKENKAKKKSGRTGKQVQRYKKKIKNKYQQYKNKKNESKDSSHGSED